MNSTTKGLEKPSDKGFMRYVLSFILAALVLSVSYWGESRLKGRGPSSVTSKALIYDPLIKN